MACKSVIEATVVLLLFEGKRVLRFPFNGTRADIGDQ